MISVVQTGVLAAAGSAFATAGNVYVADEETSTVSVIDAASFKRIRSIAVGQGPHNVQVAPDGKIVWVTNNGAPGKAAEKPAHKEMSPSDHGATARGGAVWAINTASDAVVANVSVGMHPAHVVVGPDVRYAYVTNGGRTPSASSTLRPLRP